MEVLVINAKIFWVNYTILAAEAVPTHLRQYLTLTLTPRYFTCLQTGPPGIRSWNSFEDLVSWSCPLWFYLLCLASDAPHLVNVSRSRFVAPAMCKF